MLSHGPGPVARPPGVPLLSFRPLTPKGRRLALGFLALLLVVASCGLYQGGWGPPPGPEHPEVAAVHDGDTLTVHHHQDWLRVRLHCLDAPESDQRPWGDQATTALRDLAPPGSRVDLRVHTRDVYGRLVAEVLVDGVEVNLVQVRTGRAAVYRRYCEDRRFFRAEAEAREAGRGIWAEPGLHQTPWRWRHASPGTAPLPEESPFRETGPPIR